MSPPPASAGIGKWIKKQAKKVEKVFTGGADDAKKETEKAAKDTWDFSKKSANDTKDFGKAVGDSIKETAVKSWKDTVEWAGEAWESIKKLASSLGDAILDAVVTPVVGYLADVATCIAGVEVRSPLARASARRESVGKCQWTVKLKIGSFDIGKAIVDQTKAAMKLVTIASLTNKLGRAWSKLKSSATYGDIIGKDRKAGYKKGTYSPAAKKKLLALKGAGKQSLKQSTKASAKATAESALQGTVLEVAIDLAIFPLGYLIAAGACADAPNQTESCYKREFLTYSKEWLIDSVIGVALTPLDVALITPAAAKIGIDVAAGVATAIAAVSGGTGIVAGAVIGGLTALVARIALSLLTTCIVKAAVYAVYEQTLWKETCSFFESLVSKDVLDDFGMSTAGTYTSTCPK
jgi:hypothetical protein